MSQTKRIRTKLAAYATGTTRRRTTAPKSPTDRRVPAVAANDTAPPTGAVLDRREPPAPSASPRRRPHPLPPRLRADCYAFLHRLIAAIASECKAEGSLARVTVELADALRRCTDAGSIAFAFRYVIAETGEFVSRQCDDAGEADTREHSLGLNRMLAGEIAKWAKINAQCASLHFRCARWHERTAGAK